MQSVFKAFFTLLEAFKAVILLKRELQQWCFPVNIAKFLRTPIPKNIFERLALVFTLYRDLCGFA